jgi:hypothetical protein
MDSAGLMASSCERGNDSSGRIKGGVFLDYLSDCWLLKKDCVLCS